MSCSEPAPLSLARHQVSAQMAGLNASDLSAPGWRRVRCGKGWRYLGAHAKPLLGRNLERCRGLTIPPAWSDVWINPDSRGHIQAAGTDAAGRRQYLYHPLWQKVMAAAKFEDLPEFARRLPRLRAALRKQLRSPADDRQFALAVIVGLLDCAGLRIGHRRHRQRTGAVGATTLQTRHLRKGPDGLLLTFQGKSGQKQSISVEDPEIAAALIDLTKTPGPDLFVLEEGRITASMVNEFIAEMMGVGFTSKDFRTWGGSVTATRALLASPFPSIPEVARAAADWLGNTPAVARSAYIHPAILEAAARNVTPAVRGGPVRLRADERLCYALISA